LRDSLSGRDQFCYHFAPAATSSRRSTAALFPIGSHLP
jgi:hypothetical protein